MKMNEGLAGAPLGNGSKLGRYTVLGRIGRDSSGYLYRAREVEGNRLVALRVLDPGLADDEFVDRARRAARIRHKNVQRLQGLGKAGDTHYVALEYAPGQSLRRRLEKGEPMEPYLGLQIIRRVCRALRVARSAGLGHFNLRPSAILLSASGAVKVTGIGMPLDAGRDSTCYEGVRGLVPFYAPPEDLRGADLCDERRVVFTLGAILYHMLAGRPPLCGDGLEDALARHAAGGIEPLDRIRPDLPASVRELVGRMMQTPPLRHQTLEDLSLAIRAAMRDLRGGPEESGTSAPDLEIEE